jgi:hypothetical protein
VIAWLVEHIGAIVVWAMWLALVVGLVWPYPIEDRVTNPFADE